jgi:hypothetical protein
VNVALVRVYDILDRRVVLTAATVSAVSDMITGKSQHQNRV